MCSGSFRCPAQTSGVHCCLFNPHPSVFMLWHLGELSQSLCGWRKLNLIEPAGRMLTCTLFLLNTLKPVATVKEVNALLLSCCRHRTELFTKGVKNRSSSISNGVYRHLTSFCLLEKASSNHCYTFNSSSAKKSKLSSFKTPSTS